jgi:hypothetical protein
MPPLQIRFFSSIGSPELEGFGSANDWLQSPTLPSVPAQVLSVEFAELASIFDRARLARE